MLKWTPVNRERETDRQTDRQIDRDRDRETERETLNAQLLLAVKGVTTTCLFSAGQLGTSSGRM